MDHDGVLVERQDGVCRITIDRPHARNALDLAARRALADALDAAERDGTRVVVLAGSGGRAFSSGMDLKEMAAGAASGAAFGVGDEQLLGFTQLRRCRIPVVAAIDGACVAGGFELALLCDIRLATRASTFALPEARRGVIPGPGLLDLAHALPLGEARRLQLTGGAMGAERAYQLGRVQVLADDRASLERAVDELVSEIVACAPGAVRAIKEVASAAVEGSSGEAARLLAAAQDRIARSADAIEGPRAFAERRPPRWTDS
jgi:enoyl-CoA hydratase/carnithine racemase